MEGSITSQHVGLADGYNTSCFPSQDVNEHVVQFFVSRPESVLVALLRVVCLAPVSWFSLPLFFAVEEIPHYPKPQPGTRLVAGCVAENPQESILAEVTNIGNVSVLHRDSHNLFSP